MIRDRIIDDIHWPAPLSPERFLSEYWQKKPCLIPQAFPGFNNPLPPDELAGLALEDDIPSRLIRCPADDQWTLSHGPFTEETLTSLPSSDWSLLISDVEKHLDGFDGYLEPFRFIPDWRIDDLMISYAPTGASVGAHIDAYDVFLLQANGQREWQIELEPQQHPTFIPGLDIKVLSQFTAVETHVLSPGDMLYLPPGVAHHGLSLDNDCMTWSIGFRAPAIADIVHEIAQQLTEHLTESDRLTDPDLRLQDHPGEISAQSIERIKAVWRSVTQIDDQTFATVVGKLLTQQAPDSITSDLSMSDEDTDQSQAQSIQSLDPDTEFTRHPALRLSFIQQAADCTLFANAQNLAISRPFAEFLCRHRQFTLDEALDCMDGSGPGIGPEKHTASGTGLKPSMGNDSTDGKAGKTEDSLDQQCLAFLIESGCLQCS